MPARKVSLTAFALASLILFGQTAEAHFPWLVVDQENRPRVFFGEGLQDQDYHLPETVAAAKVWQVGADAEKKAVAVAEHEEEGFVGLRAESSVELKGRLQTEVVYGVYHGSKLNYYAQCYPTADTSVWPKTPVKDLPLQALLAVEEDSLYVTLLQNGEPAKDVSVTLTNDSSKESIKADTDKEGRLKYSLDLIAKGRNGLMAMIVDKKDSGEIEGKPYTSTTHILTVTFTGKSKAKTVSALPPVPKAITSFGAAVVDGWVYVYGGHTGKAHVYSHDTLSEHFVRMPVDGSGDWEALPMDEPLQGLAMVAHGGKVYRVGGLDTRNAPGEEDDLHSVNSFACFDPATGEWASMPSLPNGRSSHNAVVLGDTLYVVGGWELAGDRGGEWQAGALAYDLSKPEAAWRKLAEPPFKRRALAVGHAGGRVVVIGGMTEDREVSNATFFFDPNSEQWSEGPVFPVDEGSFGSFGLAAWNLGGVLYAGGMEGELHRLDEEQNAWVKAAEFETPRFFHQLMPAGEGKLLAIGGASPEDGHLANVELLVLPTP